jgi:hypothetical protein
MSQTATLNMWGTRRTARRDVLRPGFAALAVDLVAL